MGLFDIFKKTKTNIAEPKKTSITNINSYSPLVSAINEHNQKNDFSYPELLQQCKEIYNSIINYECQISEKDGILLYEKMYKETSDEMFFNRFNEARHKLFVKPPIIKELIACGKEKYNLPKEVFYINLKTAFDIVATEPDFSADFCFNYLKKEIDNHYFYDKPKQVDFKIVMDVLVQKKFKENWEKFVDDCVDNRCPWCGMVQDATVVRSRKCQNCGQKIYVIKIANQKIFTKEKEYKLIKDTKEEYTAKLDFCYMILSTGYSAEELEKYLLGGNINRVNDLAWRALSKKRNECYEKGQIDMVSEINLNKAKILVWEGKKQNNFSKCKEAILFVCEAVFADLSPISFHPKFPYRKDGDIIKNDNETDTEMYNERHRPFLNMDGIKILSSLKEDFEDEEFKDIIKQSLEDCTHFYLKMTPLDVYNEIIDKV